MSRFVRWSAVVFGLAAVVAAPSGVMAHHSWAGYHWARATNPFTIKLGDNVSSTWDPYLARASANWTASAVLNTQVVAGKVDPKTCSSTLGRVEVCNGAYGDTGWLGIASLSVKDGVHITQGTVKINDTYFAKAPYNTAAWRNLVMCQEVGHTFGLSHQDVDYYNANLNTCMDYSMSPTTNQHPNSHDYSQLASIYTHRDSSTTVGLAAQPSTTSSSSAVWGREISRSPDGTSSVFVSDPTAGELVVTEVMWAVGHEDAHEHEHDGPAADHLLQARVR